MCCTITQNECAIISLLKSIAYGFSENKMKSNECKRGKKITNVDLNYLSRYGLYQRDIDVKSSLTLESLSRKKRINELEG